MSPKGVGNAKMLLITIENCAWHWAYTGSQRLILLRIWGLPVWRVPSREGVCSDCHRLRESAEPTWPGEEPTWPAERASEMSASGRPPEVPPQYRVEQASGNRQPVQPVQSNPEQVTSLSASGPPARRLSLECGFWRMTAVMSVCCLPVGFFLADGPGATAAWMFLAAMLLATCPWLVFYTARWIVRGFKSN